MSLLVQSGSCCKFAYYEGRTSKDNPVYQSRKNPGDCTIQVEMASPHLPATVTLAPHAIIRMAERLQGGCADTKGPAMPFLHAAIPEQIQAEPHQKRRQILDHMKLLRLLSQAAIDVSLPRTHVLPKERQDSREPSVIILRRR